MQENKCFTLLTATIFHPIKSWSLGSAPRLDIFRFYGLFLGMVTCQSDQSAWLIPTVSNKQLIITIAFRSNRLFRSNYLIITINFCENSGISVPHLHAGCTLSHKFQSSCFRVSILGAYHLNYTHPFNL